MLDYKKEIIYGIVVYNFKNSHEVPFQLCLDNKNESSTNRYRVTLVNLLGLNDTIYCQKLRKYLRSIIKKFIVGTEKTLVFDIMLTDYKKELLLIKFVRWLEFDPEISYNINVDNLNGQYFAEVTFCDAKA